MRQLSVLVLILISLTAVKAGPIVVGGGAGGSEFSIIFARANLGTMLADCLTVTCGLNVDEAKRFEPLHVRTKAMPVTVFKTSKELATDLYKVWPFEVWFNRDLLWLNAGKTFPFEVVDAAKLWLEIINADGVVSKTDLQLLQDRLAGSLHIEKTEQAFSTGNTFQILLWKTSSVTHRLYVSSSANSVELTNAVVEKLSCADVRSFKIQSPTWVSMAPIPSAGSPDTIVLTLSLNVNWVCGTRTHTGFGSAIIRASKNTSNVFEFDPRSLEINIGEL